jgi:glutamate decarboxylase
MLPQRNGQWEETELFLKQVVEVCLDYIREENDRSSKILDFHHPEDMKKLIDLSIPEKPMELDELVKVRTF